MDRPATHRLFYKNRVVNSGKGLSGKNAMEGQAKFCNERGLKPQKAGCRADLEPGARIAAMKKQGLVFCQGDAFPEEEEGKTADGPSEAEARGPGEEDTAGGD